MTNGFVLCHQSAAEHWGLALLQSPERPHAMVPRDASRRGVPGHRVHRADLRDDEVEVVDGIALTSALRTVCDLARTLPFPEALAVTDSALRLRRVSGGELAARAAAARGRGAGRLGRAIALADARSESFLESCCRALLIEAGLPPERIQYGVRHNGVWIGRVDFAWPSVRLIVEVDGFAFHADRARYRSDRRRLNALELAGWRVLRFSWEDVIGNPSYVISAVKTALRGVSVAA
jgi:hypothetical protein